MNKNQPFQPVSLEEQPPAATFTASSNVAKSAIFVERQTLAIENVTWETLGNLNVAQDSKNNKQNLDNLGGVLGLADRLGVSLETGLSDPQLDQMRERYGKNVFPESPMEGFFWLFVGAFEDPVLQILLAACIISIILGCIEHPENGWIEGIAIFIAVFLVAIISATNDYSKELQFRALEKESANDERVSVLRQSIIERINPKELVIGDVLILQAGDSIAADAVVFSSQFVLTNESGLTGEPDDLKKSREGDPFLLSSCLVTEGEECHALVIGTGLHSQWGKIKENLVTEAVNTPLQDKLESMTAMIGYIGVVAALGTFIAKIIRLFTVDTFIEPGEGVISAFILAVTIVVVAIPEGLPLAVTISLAYSTGKMYQHKCFIRVLAACETMGNATNICSDKTGTLTENRMTVVEGYFGDKSYTQDEFKKAKLDSTTMKYIAEQSCINRQAYLVYKDNDGKALDRPNIIGNKTEGALMLMASYWGFDYKKVHKDIYSEETDKTFSFNSTKKRSTAIIHRPDGSVTLFCKGATEWILKDCTHYLSASGVSEILTPTKMKSINTLVLEMADRALRTLCLAHKNYKSVCDLPADWRDNPPDSSGLCCDGIVGIIDPLREDVIDAVKLANAAGVNVRMITGDNIATARAIARQCGIYTDGGISIEGPDFRAMTPSDVDKILPRLQVMGRSSPDDKYLLVIRLNGHDLPSNKDEWEKKHANKIATSRNAITWETHKDTMLPGYQEEWASTRPSGGHVVGVTGDGTNDAPALKAADVGLSMGITGTKVAQGASDIVLLDDKFSSIVNAILWGRAVYDSIRKFLQFQLTVNLVALTLVFVAACTGTLTPLNAVQMLWVNLVMDTMGALALATEPPNPSMMHRKPYKRDASLISWPMWRNILFQTVFQLILVFILLYKGAELFGVHNGEWCLRWMSNDAAKYFDVDTLQQVDMIMETTVSCEDFDSYCPRDSSTYNGDCFERVQKHVDSDFIFSFNSLEGFSDACLTCTWFDYTHGSIIFNAFIFCQIFNEYTSRDIFDKWNFLDGIFNNYTFLLVSVVSIAAQIFLIEVGGAFVKTTHLTVSQWLITIALGAIGLPVGVFMRFIPVKENEESFHHNEEIATVGSDGNIAGVELVGK